METVVFLVHLFVSLLYLKVRYFGVVTITLKWILDDTDRWKEFRIKYNARLFSSVGAEV